MGARVTCGDWIQERLRFSLRPSFTTTTTFTTIDEIKVQDRFYSDLCGETRYHSDPCDVFHASLPFATLMLAVNAVLDIPCHMP